MKDKKAGKIPDEDFKKGGDAKPADEKKGDVKEEKKGDDAKPVE